MLARYLDEDEFFPDASLVVSFTLALSCPDGYSVATYRNQCKRVVSTEYGVSFESSTRWPWIHRMVYLLPG